MEILKAKQEGYRGHPQKTPESPHVVVTSGIGLWDPPFRLGSNNEVMSINLKFAG